MDISCDVINMSTADKISSMMSLDLEIGTPTKPPRLMSLTQYPTWRPRFESYIQMNDHNLMIAYEDGYVTPMQESFRGLIVKSLSHMSAEEVEKYQLEKKAYAALTMGLTNEIFHGFRQHKTAKALWDALQNRYEGNDELKKSKRDLLKKQFDVFEYLPNENLDAMITRFSYLMAEMDAFSCLFGRRNK